MEELFKEAKKNVESLILSPLDWAYSFQEPQISTLKNLYKKNNDDLWSWTLVTAILPLLTFTFAVFINLFFLDLNKSIIQQIGEMTNNGSLPIIAFGIVSSSVSYLVERLKLEKEEDESGVFAIRKRTMAVATILLFLSSGLFLLESIKVISNMFRECHHIILFAISIVISVYAVAVGRKMFVLQSNMVSAPPQRPEAQASRVSSHNQDLLQTFGQEANEQS